METVDKYVLYNLPYGTERTNIYLRDPHGPKYFFSDEDGRPLTKKYSGVRNINPGLKHLILISVWNPNSDQVIRCTFARLKRLRVKSPTERRL